MPSTDPACRQPQRRRPRATENGGIDEPEPRQRGVRARPVRPVSQRPGERGRRMARLLRLRARRVRAGQAAASATTNGESRSRSARPADTAAPLPDGATPIKGPAARLAQNMAASLEVPTATSFREIEVATLEARRRGAQRADRAAQGELHAPHRLGDRAGGDRAALDEPLLHRRSTARPTGSIREPSTSGWRSTSSARTARASWSCRSSRAPTAWTSRSSTPATRSSWQNARANKLVARRLRRRHDHAHQPGHAGHHRERPAAHAEPGHDRRDRHDPRRRRRPPHDDHLDVRPPHHPGRRVRALPAADRGACWRGDGRLLRRCLRRARRAQPTSADRRARRPTPPSEAPPRPAGSTGASDDQLQGGRRGHGARQGLPLLRPSGRPPRSARVGAAGRSGPRSGAAGPDRREHGHDPGRAAAHLRARRDAGRGAAAPPRDLHRHDRLRGRAHRLACRARVAAPGDRVRRASAADGARGPGRAARAPGRRRGPRALPPPAPTWARSGSASRASTRWCRCSTSSSATRPTRGRAR